MPALTRGPLPARVYWVRRIVVLVLALLLVLAVARLLGGGSDAQDPKADAAAAVSAPVSTAPTPGVTGGTAGTAPTAGSASEPATGATTGRRRGTVGSLAPVAPTATATPMLAAPQGECADDDVSVTPQVPKAVGGRDVRIVLLLRTMTAEACTWHTDRKSVSVDITSGKDEIWSSRQCPRAIPVQDVVVRKAATSRLVVVWNAHRSDDTCSGRTHWAMPGFYHVTAAAVGAEPADVQFELTVPSPSTIVKTASPSPAATRSPGAGRAPQVQPSGRPVTHPSR